MRYPAIFMALLTFAGAFLFPTSAACSEDGRTAACDKVFISAQVHIRDNDFNLAGDEISAYHKCAPGDPAANLLDVENRFLEKSIAQNTNDVGLGYAEFSGFMRDIAAGLAKAEIVKKNGKDDSLNEYVELALLAWRGVIEHNNSELADKYGGSDYETGKAVTKICAPAYDDPATEKIPQSSKAICGVLTYEIGTHNWFERHLASWIGLPSGDKKGGFELIRRAAVGNKSPFADDIWLLMLQLLTDKQITSRSDQALAERIFGYSVKDIYDMLEPNYPGNFRMKRLKKRFSK